MKKILLRVAMALGVVVVLAVSAIVVKFYMVSPKMRAAPNVTAPTTPEAIAKGKYIAHHVAACIGCHSPVQENIPGEPPVPGKLGGGRDFGDIPGFPGRLRAPNLTPDKESGIGNWTDGEVIRAMREGVSKDGRPLFPQMPYMTYAKTLSDEDALAVVAYLRTLPAVAGSAGPMVVDFPVSMFIRAAPTPLEAPLSAAPAVSDKMARGRWLLEVCSCADCHDTVDSHHEKIPGKHFTGGQKFPLPDGKGVAIAPNITSDKATGLGAYSEDDLKRAFDEGKNKTGAFALRHAVGLLRRDDARRQGRAHRRDPRNSSAGERRPTVGNQVTIPAISRLRAVRSQPR